MRFALNQFTLGDLPFPEFVRLAKRCAVEDVEIAELKLALDPSAAAEQMQMIADAGISVSAVVPRVHALYPDTLNPGIRDLETRLDSFHTSIDFFAKMLPGGNVPLLTITGAAPGVNLHEGYKYAVNAYRDLAQHAADVGIRVMFEPLGPVFMNTDTFVCTLYRAMDLIQAVDHTCFGLALDSWHVWDEPDLDRRIVEAGNQIFGVHISDYHAMSQEGLLTGSCRGTVGSISGGSSVLLRRLVILGRLRSRSSRQPSIRILSGAPIPTT